MAEETIKLLSINHDEKNSRYIQVHDPDHSDDPISGPVDAIPTAPPLSSDITDSMSSRVDGEDEGGKKPLMSLTQKLTFVGIAITYMAMFMPYYVLAPFFPYEAAQKGVNPTETGLVFGVFALTSFIANPIWGKYLPVIGGKFMFLSGSFVAAGCNILFGFLNRIEGKTTFLIYCFVIRIVEATGAAAVMTSGMTISANVFRDNVAQMNGLLEVFIGVGLAVGPALGSLFYGIGGYQLPFIVLGCTSIGVTILNIFILPRLTLSYDEDKGTGSLIEVLKIPAIWVALICCMWSSGSLGFVDPTLALRVTSPPLSVNPSLVGVLFLFFGGIYGIFSPICGYIADKKKTTRILMVFGAGLLGIAYMLLGPSPILHIPDRLWIVIVSLAMVGFSAANIIMPTFLDMLISADWYGLPDSLRTQAVVSGLWNGAFSLGTFIGPVGGGALVGQLGFNWSSTYLAFGSFVIPIMICLFGVWEFQCGRGRRKPSHMREQS